MATQRDNPTCVVHLTTAHLGFVAMLYSTRPGRALHIPVAVYGATVWYGTGRTNERTTTRSARPAGKQPIRNEHPHIIKVTNQWPESRLYVPPQFSNSGSVWTQLLYTCCCDGTLLFFFKCSPFSSPPICILFFFYYRDIVITFLSFGFMCVWIHHHISFGIFRSK